MRGRTLGGLRERIDDLAADDGEYYVVCERTGTRPVPVAEKRFQDRDAARRAAAAAERYRAGLRRYDPQVSRYDLVVVRSDHAARAPGHACRDFTDAQWTFSEPVITGTDGNVVDPPIRRPPR